MRREQLEHVIRAACAATGVRDVVVIGSQAILATYPVGLLPDEATRSVEADIAIDARLAGGVHIDEEALADQIDGAIGDQSRFLEQYGYYAQGVETITAVLPDLWRDRLVPVVCEAVDDRPACVGWCLEAHDLWISKAAARRPKDVEFCVALAEASLIERDALETRVEHIDERYRANVRVVVERSFR